MLIYISESIVEAVENGHQEAIESLNLVSQSAVYGNHILYSTRELLERIHKVAVKESYTDKAVKNILGNYATFGNIINRVSFYFKLFYSTHPSMSLNNDGVHRVVNISHRAYLTAATELINKTILLLENIDDAPMYEHIANFYQESICAGKINLSFKPECGGGRTTHQTFQYYVDNPERFCLCIVDTDKYHYADDVGSTLNSIRPIAEQALQNAKHLCHLDDTNVRELENLIPIGLFHSLAEDSSKQECACRLKKIYELNSELFLHFDIKKGLTKKAYKAMGEDFCLLHIIDTIICCEFGICDRAALDNIKITDKPDGDLITGMGDKVLSAYNEYQKSPNGHSYEDIDNALAEEQKREWLRLGQIVNDWTCASQPIRS